MKATQKQILNQQYEKQLYKAIAMIQSEQEARAFFQDLCTPAEIQALADRWAVVDHIKQSEPYRQIYDETGVSVTTIGRVARCIALGAGGYNLIHQRMRQINHEIIKAQNSSSKKRALKQ